MDASKSNSYLDAIAAAISTGGKLFKGGDTTSMLGEGMNKKYLVVVPQPEYAPGDDVTFKNMNGGYTTHRVTHTKPGFVYTKGTFNRSGDGWIPLKDVVGKVTKVR